MLRTLRLSNIPVYNVQQDRRHNLRNLAALTGMVAYNALVLALSVVNALSYVAMAALVVIITVCARFIDSLVHPPRKEDKRQRR